MVGRRDPITAFRYVERAASANFGPIYRRGCTFDDAYTVFSHTPNLRVHHLH